MEWDTFVSSLPTGVYAVEPKGQGVSEDAFLFCVEFGAEHGKAKDEGAVLEFEGWRDVAFEKATHVGGELLPDLARASAFEKVVSLVLFRPCFANVAHRRLDVPKQLHILESWCNPVHEPPVHVSLARGDAFRL